MPGTFQARTGDGRDEPRSGAPASASHGLDSADTPRDVIDALILAAFTEGSQPFARTARLQEVRRGAAMVPAGAAVLRAAVDGPQEALLATGDG
jgi:hypothetical protein